MSNAHKNQNERAERKKIIIIFSVIYLIALLAIVFVITSALTYNKVYAGVYLNGQDVSGMTKEELRQMIDTNYNDAFGNSKIYFTYDKGNTILGSILVKELGIQYKTDEIVEAVYTPGHEGSMFSRLSEILRISKNKLYIDPYTTEGRSGKMAQYDANVIDAKITELINQIAGGTTQHSVYLNQETSELEIRPGKAGLSVEREKLKAKILSEAGASNQVYINLDEISEMTQPEALDVNGIYNKYNKPAKNAQYAFKDATRQEVIILPEENGYKLKIDDLVSVRNKIQADPSQVYTVKLQKDTAEIKAADLPEARFQETIGKGSTGYKGSSFGRKTNIELGTKTINGYILLPGEVFSFNDYVGDTTPDKGYEQGIGYENGEQVPTYGGGICQVSSTLYNAVIRAGLNVEQRYCHSMTVGYLPKGMDAAVAYGVKNFSFKNSLKVPVMIVGNASSGSLVFEIKGIQQNKGTEYSFSSEKINEFKDNGKTYHVYQTYRTVKVNGTIIENKAKFNRSTYLIK